MKRMQIFKANFQSKNGVIIFTDTNTALPNADRNNGITQRDHQNTKNQNFYEYMKKDQDQSLPNKIIQSNNSSAKPLPTSY